MSSLSGTTQASSSSGDDNTQNKIAVVIEDPTSTAFPKSQGEGFEDLHTALTLSLGTVRLNLDSVSCEGTFETKASQLHQAFDSLVNSGELLKKLHDSQSLITDDKNQTQGYKSQVERLAEDMDSTFEAYSDESRMFSKLLSSDLGSGLGSLAFLMQAGDGAQEENH